MALVVLPSFSCKLRDAPWIWEEVSFRSMFSRIFFLQASQQFNSFKLSWRRSRFLQDSEARNAIVELELLTVVWAVQKCRLYLLGLSSFNVVTDHQPSIPIRNHYTLDMVENPRLCFPCTHSTLCGVRVKSAPFLTPFLELQWMTQLQPMSPSPTMLSISFAAW